MTDTAVLIFKNWQRACLACHARQTDRQATDGQTRGKRRMRIEEQCQGAHLWRMKTSSYNMQRVEACISLARTQHRIAHTLKDIVQRLYKSGTLHRCTFCNLRKLWALETSQATCLQQVQAHSTVAADEIPKKITGRPAVEYWKACAWSTPVLTQL